MLDFILVMGHVPGTNIDITFTELLIMLPIAGLIIYLVRHKPLTVKRWSVVAYLSSLYVYYSLVAQTRRLLNSFHHRLPA